MYVCMYVYIYIYINVFYIYIYTHRGLESPEVLRISSMSMAHLGREILYYTPPPPGSDFTDCKCARIETKASIHYPLWVVVVVVVVAVVVVALVVVVLAVVAVVVYRIGLPNTSARSPAAAPHRSSSRRGTPGGASFYLLSCQYVCYWLIMFMHLLICLFLCLLFK